MATAEAAGAGEDHAGAFLSVEAFFTALGSCDFMANAGSPCARARTRPVSLDEIDALDTCLILDYLPGLEMHKELWRAAQVVCRSFRRPGLVGLVLGMGGHIGEARLDWRYRQRLVRILHAWQRRTGKRAPADVKGVLGEVLPAVAALIHVGALDQFPMLRFAAEVVLDGHVPGDIEPSPDGDTLQVY